MGKHLLSQREEKSAYVNTRKKTSLWVTFSRSLGWSGAAQRHFYTEIQHVDTLVAKSMQWEGSVFAMMSARWMLPIRTLKRKAYLEKEENLWPFSLKPKPGALSIASNSHVSSKDRAGNHSFNIDISVPFWLYTATCLDIFPDILFLIFSLIMFPCYIRVTTDTVNNIRSRHSITWWKYFPAVLILGLRSARGRLLWVLFSLNFINLWLRDEFKRLKILRSHKTRRPKTVTTRTSWVVDSSGSLTEFFHLLIPNDL